MNHQAKFKIFIDFTILNFDFKGAKKKPIASRDRRD
jgi:hypothetical protein